MKILVTDSTGVLIPISIGDGKTFPEVDQRIENDHGMRMNFINLQNEDRLNLDQNMFSHFSDKEVEEERAYLKNIKLEHIRESSSNFSENIVKVVIPSRARPLRSEPELLEEFHAVMERIKTENMDIDQDIIEENIEEEIETFETKPIVLSKNGLEPRSAESLQFSEVILESTNHTCMTLLCRLCATRCEDMIFIFNQNKEYENVIDMIKNCLPIMVSDTDTLPKQICRWCMEKLELCHKFRRTVAEAERQLIMLEEKFLYEMTNVENDQLSSPFYNEKENEDAEEEDDKEKDEGTVVENEKAKVTRKVQEEKEREEGKKGGEKGEEKENEPKAGEELGSDEESSEEEQQEYLPPRSRIIGSNNNTKESSNNPQSSVLQDSKENSSNPGTKLRSVEQMSKDEPYAPPTTRTGESFTIAEELNKTDQGNKFVQDITNDHTYASQTSEPGTIKCRICGIYFETARSCYFHAIAHSSKGYYPCSICKKSFQSEQFYCKHSVKHTWVRKSRRYVCDTCGKIFVTKDRLQFHQTYHNPEVKSYYCEKCDKAITSESVLYQHMIDAHKRRVKCSCHICGKRFRNQSQLRVHLGQRDNVSMDLSLKVPAPRKTRIFECSLCQSKFYSNDQVAVHRRHHCRGTAKFTCSYCEKSFSRKWSLSNHIRLHTGECPFSCHFCKKSYKTKRARDQHEMTHKEKVKFKCTWCKRSFCDITKLKTHESFHFKHKSEFFITCSNAFKMDSDNNTNMEKRFRCDNCGKNFLGPSTLEIHMKTQHKAN